MMFTPKAIIIHHLIKIIALKVKTCYCLTTGLSYIIPGMILWMMSVNMESEISKKLKLMKFSIYVSVDRLSSSCETQARRLRS